jgi:hypothetical protein
MAATIQAQEVVRGSEDPTSPKGDANDRFDLRIKGLSGYKPMNKMFKRYINLFLYFEAYYGEGEGLVFMEKHSTALRFGIALFR